MQYRKAWKLLDAGKFIRRETWPEGRHVRYIKPIGYAVYSATGHKELIDLCGPDRRASDWVEYTT